MKIERVAIRGFGRFEGFDSGPEPLAPLTVVTGPNESGKSTFFSFLTTLLYGFSPAALERHPYAPWTGVQMEGEAALRLDDGTELVLKRRLLGAPWGRLEVAAAETDLRNRPLPFVEHVPRSVFTQVYALTLAELGRLEGATWSAIQDRMIASLIADDVRPASEVLEELLAEAGGLWRPNRRGNQSSRALADEIRDLQQRRREAAERDTRVRALDRTWGERRETLVRLRSERASCLAHVERLERLLPDSHRLQRLEALAARAAAPGTASLPLDPRGELERLVRDTAGLGERVAELERSRRGRVERATELGARAAPVLEAEAQWRAVRAEALRALAAETELAALDREPRPPADLDSVVVEPPAARFPAWIAALAGAAALVALLVWARSGSGLAGIVGVALALLAGSTGAWAWSRQAQERRARVDAELAAERRRTRLDEARRLEERRASLLQDVERGSEAAESLAERFGIFGGGGLTRTLEELERRRTEAGAWSAEARSLAETAEALAEEHEAVRARQRETEDARAALVDRLERLGEGDLERGIQTVEQTRAQGGEARRLTAEIEARHGSVAGLRVELERHAAELGPVREEALAEARAQVQEFTEQIEDLRGEVAGLEKDLTHLKSGPSVADVDSEIESLKEERARQERERDRKVLLARIIEEADRRFRERHQPDVVRRGADYVARITSGRYRSLTTGEGPGDAMLYVKHNGGPGIDVAGPLSTGTKEQIYLALRLAVVDHLDSGRERLPLFLDESFVNWDAERRDQGFRLLRELSRSRQIFVFTCHRDLADRLDTLGARVVRLGDGEQVELW
ncbi:MAG: AAA family ATPase [Gemmatimonadota bacterium]